MAMAKRVVGLRRNEDGITIEFGEYGEDGGVELTMTEADCLRIGLNILLRGDGLDPQDMGRVLSVDLSDGECTIS